MPSIPALEYFIARGGKNKHIRGTNKQSLTNHDNCNLGPEASFLTSAEPCSTSTSNLRPECALKHLRLLLLSHYVMAIATSRGRRHLERSNLTYYAAADSAAPKPPS